MNHQCDAYYYLVDTPTVSTPCLLGPIPKATARIRNWEYNVTCFFCGTIRKQLTDSCPTCGGRKAAR